MLRLTPAPRWWAYSADLTDHENPPSQPRPIASARKTRCCLRARNHAAHHEVTGCQQGQRIDQRRIAIQRRLVFIEQLDMIHPGERIGGEEHREHQQFSQDENPDRQIARRIAGARVAARCASPGYRDFRRRWTSDRVLYQIKKKPPALHPSMPRLAIRDGQYPPREERVRDGVSRHPLRSQADAFLPLLRRLGSLPPTKKLATR